MKCKIIVYIKKNTNISINVYIIDFINLICMDHPNKENKHRKSSWKIIQLLYYII